MQAHSKRGRAPLVRVLGNLLIVAGLLMLLGIGGWWGYTQWSNAQYVEEIKSQFGEEAFEPAALATPRPTEVPPPTPLPNLAASAVGLGVPSGGSRSERQIDNSPPVRLHIPAVGIDSEVVPVGWSMIPSPEGASKAEWQVADYAVGHHLGSANPGQVGNVVLSGHVDYKGQVFRELHKTSKGDEVVVYTENGQYIYVVTDIVIVREEGVSDEQKRQNARYMDATPDPSLTMITCWPYGIDTHRLIVIAKPYQSSLSTLSEYTLR